MCQMLIRGCCSYLVLLMMLMLFELSKLLLIPYKLFHFKLVFYCRGNLMFDLQLTMEDI